MVECLPRVKEILDPVLGSMGWGGVGMERNMRNFCETLWGRSSEETKLFELGLEGCV